MKIEVEVEVGVEVEVEVEVGVGVGVGVEDEVEVGVGVEVEVEGCGRRERGPMKIEVEDEVDGEEVRGAAREPERRPPCGPGRSGIHTSSKRRAWRCTKARAAGLRGPGTGRWSWWVMRTEGMPGTRTP
jgi:hypothetical protein